MKKREHVIFHLLHGTEVSHCQFYETPEVYLSMCVCVYLHVHMATYTCDSVYMYEHVYVYNRGGESFKNVREQNLNIDSIVVVVPS